jgi:hypothetical protein
MPSPIGQDGTVPTHPAWPAAAPRAFVSVDIDPIDTHVAGYGFTAPPCDLVYRIAVPRLLDLLDHVGLRATLFVVARDAQSQATLWREALQRGHEIASHSITHPLPFADLAAAELRREVVESRQRLEDATGVPVLGFRAPGWDIDRAALDAVVAAGYRYDASILPTPALLAGAAVRFVLSGGRMRPHGVGRSLRAAWSRRRPYRLRGSDLWVFPIAVSPLVRLPFTHTLWYVAPRALCLRIHRAMRRGDAPLSYMLHAVDLLSLERDGVDTRMARHPGMQLPLEDKLALLAERLRAIADDFRVTTYADCVLADTVNGGMGPRLAIDETGT